MSLRKFLSVLRHLFVWPRAENDPECRIEFSWADGFAADPQEPFESPKLILEQAEKYYEESRGMIEYTDSKANELLKLAGVLAAIVATAIGAGWIPLCWPVEAALVCLLLTMFLAVLARFPLGRSLRPSIRVMIQKLDGYSAATASLWTACSLHRSIVDTQYVNDVKAFRVKAASCCILVAMTLLAAACLLFVKPTAHP